MVENQCASSDMSQSKLANATVIEKYKNAGCTDFAKQSSKSPVIGLIHFDRHFMELIAQKSPNSKIDELTNYKKGSFR